MKYLSLIIAITTLFSCSCSKENIESELSIEGYWQMVGRQVEGEPYIPLDTLGGIHINDSVFQDCGYVDPFGEVSLEYTFIDGELSAGPGKFIFIATGDNQRLCLKANVVTTFFEPYSAADIELAKVKGCFY